MLFVAIVTNIWTSEIEDLLGLVLRKFFGMFSAYLSKAKVYLWRTFLKIEYLTIRLDGRMTTLMYGNMILKTTALPVVTDWQC